MTVLFGARAAGARAALGVAVAVLGAAALAGCEGGSSGGAAAPARTIVTAGGSGAAGDGGDGGRLLISGIPGEDVKVLRSGAVDTAFSVPADEPKLGDNPLIVSVDTLLSVPSDGRVSGTAVPTATATGLRVERGATLLLVRAPDPEPEPEPEIAADDGEAGPRVLLRFDEGAIIDGAIRPGVVGLELEARSVRIGESGEIVSSGPEEGSFDEGASPSGVAIECLGTIVVAGRITARGEDGTSGGDGGSVLLATEFLGGVYCTGTIDVSGGAGHDETGGAGGQIEASAGLAGVFLSGSLLAPGGAGARRGGSGGTIEIDGKDLSEVVSSGALDVSGGPSAGSLEVDGTAFSGGDAGGIEVVSSIGNLRIAGSLLARGGDGARISGGRAGRGGLVVVVQDWTDSDGLDSRASCVIGADVDARGGSAGVGGEGGLVILGADPFEEFVDVVGDSLPREVTLVGYSHFDVSGGASTGGRGGDAARSTFFSDPPRGLLESPGVIVTARPHRPGASDLVFEVDVIGRGGAAAELFGEGGRGGRGAGVEIRIKDERTVTDAQVSSASVYGSLDVRGGDGVRGGRGGQVALSNVPLGDGVANGSLARELVVAGLIDASGGAGRQGLVLAGAGGAGGQVELVALPGGVLTSTGVLRSTGGACADGRGGDGGLVMVLGGVATRQGDISCDGGAGQFGGAGGRFPPGANPLELLQGLPADLDSPEDIAAGTDDQSQGFGGIFLARLDHPMVVSGFLSVLGGRGTHLDGTPGSIFLDGIDVDTTGSEVLP